MKIWFSEKERKLASILIKKVVYSPIPKRHKETLSIIIRTWLDYMNHKIANDCKFEELEIFFLNVAPKELCDAYQNTKVGYLNIDLLVTSVDQ